MKNNKMLSGVRVIDLSTYVAAPICSRVMADWGADVIKIESMYGDAWRQFGTTMKTPIQEGENPMWEIANSNKRAVALNLKTSEGQEVFHKLLETADVFITNNRTDALVKLNLDYDSIKEKYPQLVYAQVTGFGDNGPDVDLPGFDTAAYWARSGFLADLVKPDEYPVYNPAGFGDASVGSALLGGICAALFNRQKTGRGDRISISLYGAAIWFASFMITSSQECYGNKFPKTRFEGHPLAIPYRCKDGEWIMPTIIEFNRYWKPFCTAIGREDLVDDERFNTIGNVMNNKKDLIMILEEAFISKDSKEWIKILQEADIVHERLRRFKDVSTDPQAWANDYLREFTFVSGAKAVLTCPPIQSAEITDRPYERAPFLGEHTVEILKELGYSADKIEEMTGKKAIKVR